MTACPVCHSKSEEVDRGCWSCGLSLRAARAPEVALPAGVSLAGGRFVIERALGQGGHGITYRSLDRERSCQVAIKELFIPGCIRRGHAVRPPPGAGFTFARLRDHFLREARELHRLNHPSIIRVHLDFEENNTAYLVMEFLRGRNLLHRTAERGALPEGVALEYAVRVGDALGLVHRAGLLHLDVKPENILATPDRRVVLIDFDCARELREFGGGRMLTPGYAPLEQYIDDAPLGPYSDVYAVAATLYHLLGGEPPAPSPDRARGVALRPLRRLNPAVSEPISRAVERGLALYPRDRPQRMGDLLAALQEGVVWAAPRVRRLGEHAGCVRGVAFSPDLRTGSARLASVGDDRLVRLWNVATGEEERLGESAQRREGLIVTSIPSLLYQNAPPGDATGPGALHGVTFSADGRLLAAAGEDALVWLWEVGDRLSRRPLAGHDGPVTTVAFSRPRHPGPAMSGPLSALLASGGWDATVRLWELDSGSSRLLGGHRQTVTAVAFSPTGQLLASAGEDGQLLLWDLDGSAALRLDGHDGTVHCLAFHPSGTLLASGGSDGTVRLWDVVRGREIRRMEGCRKGVTCLAFSPDGKVLAAGGEDFSIGLWHIPTGWQDARLEGHTGRLSAVAFSPDGSTLATGSWDQTVRLWQLP